MNPTVRLGIVGHRGAGKLAPENTLAAIYTALRMGLDGIECDIQVTSDGEPVLLHDTTLNRTTDGFGQIVDHSVDDLQSLDAGGWYHYIYKGEKIPTLREALELIDGRLTVFLEIKTPSGVEPTADIMQEFRAETWCMIVSSAENVLAQCAKRIPDAPRTILVHPEAPPDPAELIGHMTSIPAGIVGLSPRWLEPDLMDKIRQAGFRVVTGPVDTRDQCDEVFSLLPDYILTNRPDVVGVRLDDQASA
ncbi:MAG: glycerophosphodiester phosphodiesterase [Gemmatimonadota bacterium]|nr:glycerophosphodiester phosphodiesterase [Gemmatimonadota bacterium]